MRLEDMKNDIPETPDFIHNMIQNEVAKQLCTGSFHGSICRSKSVSLVFGKTGFLWCFSQN